MIDGKRVLALIPARGGSKGIKNKNIYPILGRPLISYTIKSSCKSQYIDTTVVSTDSKRIAEISEVYGAEVPFMRPRELAQDTSKSIEAVIHAIDYYKDIGMPYDIIILLQATSPLRDTNDIDGALEFFISKNYRSLLSVSELEVNPLLIRSMDERGKLKSLLHSRSDIRRQDFKTYYKVNGAIYINYCDDITYNTSLNDNEFGYIIPLEHSIDIDTLSDIEEVSNLLNM